MALLETIRGGIPLQRMVLLCLPLAVIVFLAYRFICAYSHQLPRNAPPVVKGDFPLTGAWGFWGERWEFCRRARDLSATGNYSFHAGSLAVIGLSGEKGRHAFFDRREMGLVEGYAAMFGEAPNIQEHEKIGVQDEHSSPFNRRVAWLLKSEQLQKKLPTMISDIRDGIEAISKSPQGRTNPFESIYRLIFRLTMRMIGIEELAEDSELRRQFMHYFEMIDESATPAIVMFPRFPWPALIKRFYAGTRLYLMIERIAKKRRQSGKNPKEVDALQYLLERGDGMQEIVFFITGALFAGQLNSGINAAMVLCYLATSPDWLAKVRTEVQKAASKYSQGGEAKDPSSLLEQLDALPLEAWEAEFPLIQMCLRDSIRLNLPGTFFRKNVSSEPIPTGHGDEMIPPGSFPVYHVTDVHMDPEVYTEPHKWDPSRYTSERAEDKKTTHAYLGWGSGRHPCMGMRFAKLEQNIITAYFVAAFDFHLEDEQGAKLTEMEHGDINAIANHVPKKPYFLKLTGRK